MHQPLCLLIASILPFSLLAATSDQNIVAKTRSRVKENSLRPLERKMDLIGWVPTLPEALKLAKETNRPVFLLTYYGSIALGRCDGDSYVLRSVALNSDSIISTLNEFFVPVYRSWDDFGPQGKASEEEKQQHHRIVQEALDRKIPVADVRIFILTPDGHPMTANFGVTDPYRILRGLLQVVLELGTKQGQVLHKPSLQSVPPEMPPGSLAMHTVVRGSRDGSWRTMPAENWTVFGKDDVAKLLPPIPDVKPGVSWNIDPKTATALLTTFYPATEEDSRKDRNFLQKIAMKARIISVEDGVAIARLEASMKGRRSFYPGREPTDHLEAKAEGFLRFPVDRSDVFSIALATTDAAYEDEDFTATLEDVKEIPGK